MVQPGGVVAAGGPAAGEPAGPGQEPFEVPLPFGYHLDLDFLRVCSGELVSGETLQVDNAKPPLLLNLHHPPTISNLES